MTSDLIKGLKSIAKRPQTESGCVLIDVDDLQEAITALESMPVWVRCSERLPETEGDYLLFDGQESGEGSWNEKLGFRWTKGWPAAVQLWCVIPSPPTQITG